MSVADVDNPVSVERMWVIVRQRVPEGYLGVLDNKPNAIEENDDFWRGIEVSFAARHVIDIEPRTEESVALVSKEPKRRWL